MQPYIDAIAVVALVLEALGVVAIVLGFTLATIRFLKRKSRFSSYPAYVRYRHEIGRSLLLGLDFLIAGDVIKTVIVSEGLSSVLVLGGVVLIRVVLGITLHLEIEGRWPWQPRHPQW